MAPPGYAGYQAAPFSQVPLKRIKGAAVASSVLVAVVAALSVIELLARRAVRADAQAFRDGVIDNTAFVEQTAGYLLVSVVIFVATVGAAVLSIVLMSKVSSNLRALHRGTTWGPGWAIGGWFAPPGLYVIPTLMMREYWQASDPDVPIGGTWRSARSTPLPLVWFVLYAVAPIVLTVVQIGSDGLANVLGGTEDQIADQILGDQTWSIVSALLAVAAAAVWIVYVRSLSARHRRLTGEAGAH